MSGGVNEDVKNEILYYVIDYCDSQIFIAKYFFGYLSLVLDKSKLNNVPKWFFSDLPSFVAIIKQTLKLSNAQ